MNAPAIVSRAPLYGDILFLTYTSVILFDRLFVRSCARFAVHCARQAATRFAKIDRRPGGFDEDQRRGRPRGTRLPTGEGGRGRREDSSSGGWVGEEEVPAPDDRPAARIDAQSPRSARSHARMGGSQPVDYRQGGRTDVAVCALCAGTLTPLPLVPSSRRFLPSSARIRSRARAASSIPPPQNQPPS
jgi:hypothetical protein